MKIRTNQRSFAFAETPVPGTAVSIHSQRYDFAGLVDHDGRNGIVKLAAWNTTCRQCGAPFVCMSSPLAFPETRNCEAHRAKSYAQRKDAA